MLPSISGTTPRGNVVIVVGGAVDERARARARGVSWRRMREKNTRQAGPIGSRRFWV
jgi:hypothetical protein